jgi:hypothetical protein
VAKKSAYTFVVMMYHVRICTPVGVRNRIFELNLNEKCCYIASRLGAAISLLVMSNFSRYSANGYFKDLVTRALIKLLDFTALLQTPFICMAENTSVGP